MKKVKFLLIKTEGSNLIDYPDKAFYFTKVKIRGGYVYAEYSGNLNLGVDDSTFLYENPKIKSTKFYQRFLKKDRTSIQNSSSDTVKFFWDDINYNRFVDLIDESFLIKFTAMADAIGMTGPERTAVLVDGVGEEVYNG